MLNEVKSPKNNHFNFVEMSRSLLAIINFNTHGNLVFSILCFIDSWSVGSVVSTYMYEKYRVECFTINIMYHIHILII